MKHHVAHLGHHHKLYTLCFIGFLITISQTLPTYINSSFLNTFTNEQTVGLIYSIVSLSTIVSFLLVHYVLKRFGLYRATVVFSLLQFICIFGIINSGSLAIVGPLFVCLLVLMNLTSFNLDIFLEADSDTKHTGSIRGLYMTVVNIGWLLTPMFAGALIEDGGYAKIFTVSAMFLLPFIYLVNKGFAHFKDPVYSKLSIRQSLNATFANKDLRNLFLANITLQTFYAWMIVYSPIYLNKYLHYGWDDIGIIFTIMLLPFVLVEYPLGKLSDRKWGEKELMCAGFILLSISTMCLTFLDHTSIIWWAIMLFITRIGAAMAEIMIETYFFKKVQEKDSNLLGIFRITRPMSYFIAPAITGIGLMFVEYQHLFIILGVFTLLGAFFSTRITDTN
ncbi:MAG: MFS transporter [Candidatus Taylorbacteria bacterium]|nr:MFS transporter [Candidatus Taylorbacteria bacterium]